MHGKLSRLNVAMISEDLRIVHCNIVVLAHKVGFNKVKESDVQQLLESRTKPLSNEDLMLDKQREVEEKKNEDVEQASPPHNFNCRFKSII